MAITHNEVQITWPTAADYLSIASATEATSEAVTINTAAIDAMICLKADNDGTPATGDTVDFYILYTSGDPDGASGDEYDSEEHAIHLANLNTFGTETPGEDPAIVHVPISSAAKGFKIFAVNNSSGRAITVSATMTEVRG